MKFILIKVSLIHRVAMKKDIPQHKVQDLAIAIVPSHEDDILWNTYIINLKDEPIKSVLVNSRGYGELEGENIKTSVLRHFFKEIGPLKIEIIEPIQTKLFNITKEYWERFQYGE